MKHVSLGGLDVSRLGLGAMSMSAYYTGAGSDDAESVRTVHRALDLGVTHIDTAEVYGPFTDEELVGRALKGRRDQVVPATKSGGGISHSGREGVGPDSSPAQTALAWLLAQGDDIAPIPGTKRVSRVEENSAADGIELTADQIARLNDLTPAAGDRHDDISMAVIDR
ncbi:aldo/keto reductase [Streptomyces sp. NPDC090108]|uniref:aldo/keto reductase n=1 Tax=Streptomyces sp. NPDC090108 TaxID=3365947 RepID=UPI0037F5268C